MLGVVGLLPDPAMPKSNRGVFFLTELCGTDKPDENTAAKTMDDETWSLVYGDNRFCEDPTGEGWRRLRPWAAVPKRRKNPPPSTSLGRTACPAQPAKHLPPSHYHDTVCPFLAPGCPSCGVSEEERDRAARQRTDDEMRRYLLRDLAHAAEQAATIFRHSGEWGDLAMARVLRAVAFIGATGEDAQRLEEMAESARVLLARDKKWRSLPVHFDGYEAWGDVGVCEQPFRAEFSVKTRDLLETSKRRFATRLRDAATEWARDLHERPDMQASARHAAAVGHEEGVGTEAWIARKTTSELFEALSNAQPSRELCQRVGLPYRDSWFSSDLYVELKTKIILRVFQNTKPRKWHTDETGEKVVRHFLRALGVPAAKVKNFFAFDANDDPEPPPESQPRARKGQTEAK